MTGRKKLRWLHGACYIAVQIVCAAFACVIYGAMYSEPLQVMVFPVKDRATINGNEAGYTEATVVGVVYSFVVCYVVLATSTVVGIYTDLKRTFYSGLAYGFASAAGGFVLLHLSNALANPALMLGQGLTVSFEKYQTGVSLTAAALPFLMSCFSAISFFFGAVFASVTFRITHASDFEKYFDEETPLIGNVVDTMLSIASRDPKPP